MWIKKQRLKEQKKQKLTRGSRGPQIQKMRGISKAELDGYMLKPVREESSDNANRIEVCVHNQRLV